VRQRTEPIFALEIPKNWAMQPKSSVTCNISFFTANISDFYAQNSAEQASTIFMIFICQQAVCKLQTLWLVKAIL